MCHRVVCDARSLPFWGRFNYTFALLFWGMCNQIVGLSSVFRCPTRRFGACSWLFSVATANAATGRGARPLQPLVFWGTESWGDYRSPHHQLPACDPRALESFCSHAAVRDPSVVHLHCRCAPALPALPTLPTLLVIARRITTDFWVTAENVKMPVICDSIDNDPTF